jgi:glycosyltransferase involved in cell wall biosynthesis
MPNVQVGWAARRGRKPLIMSPRGMLSQAALSFSRRKKQVIWSLLQGSIMRHAACLHATSEAEYIEIRAAGLSNPVAIIPNGIDIPTCRAERRADIGRIRTVLYLGRIHPKKGLDRLVDAWSQIESKVPAWRLQILGPAESGYDAELRAQVARLGLTSVSIDDAIYGDAKLSAYRRADLFVLPTLNENFGLTVAEALAAETPVIATMGAPWSGLKSEGCGWWIDHGADLLASTLARAMDTNADELRAMGQRGRAWMERDFSWRRVAEDMLDVYRWLASGAEAPALVRFD